ncbi:hypothetical protein ACIPPS_11995 [Streptomyces sp. NPDC090127]|uniref:hypothetical protein n=1 Tax=Streptomyces sp. NPDC090127 TaxID=3365953 RepID=UPI003819C6A9
MTLVTVLILVAVLAFIALLVLAPSAPARRNPFPGRPRRSTHRRSARSKLTKVPSQRGIQHHAR